MAFVAAALLSQPARAAEADCDAKVQPWVRFEGGRLPESLELPEIFRQVRAELERREIRVCTEGRGEPVAVVGFEPGSPTAIEVVVDVRDQVTHKRVSRMVDLRGTPRDARPLAVAVATDELLTASWAEVTLQSAPEEPPPQEVTAAVSQKMKPRERRAEAGAALAFDAYGGGQRFLGLDVRAGYRLASRVALTGRLALRRGFDETAPNGTVGSAAWGAGLGVRVTAAEPSKAIALAALARVDVLAVSFSPDGNPGAIEHARAATALVGTAGVSLRAEPAPAVRLGVEALAGTPFRPVTATDTGGEVSAVSGLALGCAAEVILAF